MLKIQFIIGAFFITLSTSSFAADTFTGYYQNDNNGMTDVRVKKIAPNKLNFDINYWGSNSLISCELGNLLSNKPKSASISGNIATYEDKKGCIVKLSFGNDKVTVNANDKCNSYCKQIEADVLNVEYSKASKDPKASLRKDEYAIDEEDSAPAPKKKTKK